MASDSNNFDEQVSNDAQKATGVARNTYEVGKQIGKHIGSKAAQGAMAGSAAAGGAAAAGGGAAASGAAVAAGGGTAMAGIAIVILICFLICMVGLLFFPSTIIGFGDGAATKEDFLTAYQNGQIRIYEKIETRKRSVMEEAMEVAKKAQSKYIENNSSTTLVDYEQDVYTETYNVKITDAKQKVITSFNAMTPNVYYESTSSSLFDVNMLMARHYAWVTLCGEEAQEDILNGEYDEDENLDVVESDDTDGTKSLKGIISLFWSAKSLSDSQYGPVDGNGNMYNIYTNIENWLQDNDIFYFEKKTVYPDKASTAQTGSGVILSLGDCNTIRAEETYKTKVKVKKAEDELTEEEKEAGKDVYVEKNDTYKVKNYEKNYDLYVSLAIKTRNTDESNAFLAEELEESTKKYSERNGVTLEEAKEDVDEMIQDIYNTLCEAVSGSVSLSGASGSLLSIARAEYLDWVETGWQPSKATKYAAGLSTAGYSAHETTSLSKSEQAEYSKPTKITDWCAYFVNWCALQAGLLGDEYAVMPYGTDNNGGSCTRLAEAYKNQGRWVSKDSINISDVQSGWIILFKNSECAANEYSHVGIVDYVDVENNLVWIYEGNTTQNSETSSEYVVSMSALLEDASKMPSSERSVVQHNAKGWDSVSSSSGQYIAGFFSPAYPEATYGEDYDSKYDTSTTTGVANLMFDFLTEQCGYSDAVAIGLIGLFDGECGLTKSGANIGQTNESVTTSSYGICQWTGTRRKDLVEWCTNNGFDYKTFTGQLYFFKHEIEETSEGTSRIKYSGVQKDVTTESLYGKRLCDALVELSRRENSLSVANIAGYITNVTYERSAESLSSVITVSTWSKQNKQKKVKQWWSAYVNGKIGLTTEDS